MLSCVGGKELVSMSGNLGGKVTKKAELPAFSFFTLLLTCWHIFNAVNFSFLV